MTIRDVTHGKSSPAWETSCGIRLVCRQLEMGEKFVSKELDSAIKAEPKN